jgi:hypothetical protein
MAHSPERPEADTVAYHGEVWTDGRGYATVVLPAQAAPLAPPLEYELRDLEPPSTARVTSEFRDGRFTVRTHEPHVKVGWRVSGRPGREPRRQPEGESRA